MWMKIVSLYRTIFDKTLFETIFIFIYDDKLKNDD